MSPETPRLTTDVIAQALSTLTPFASMTPRALEAMASSLPPRDAPAQTVLLREGAATSEALLIARGQVGLYKNLGTPGRSARVRVGVAGPGALVGHEGFLDGGPLPYSALALSRALVLRVDRSTFQALAMGEGALGTSLLEPALRSASGHALAMRRALVALLREPGKHVALARSVGAEGPAPQRGRAGALPR